MLTKLKKLYAEHFDFEVDNEISVFIKSYLNGEDCANTKYKAFFDNLSVFAGDEVEGMTQIDVVKTKEDLKTLLFKENALNLDDNAVEDVRKLREVTITEHKSAITCPHKQVLLTSNVMLTLPKKIEDVPEIFRDKIDMTQKQEFWFDHPIPLDIKDESNEILYGLVNLNKSLSYELKKGEKMKIALSVSCTHSTLQAIAKDYFLYKLKDEVLDYLDIYVFTETECQALMDLLFKNVADADMLAKLKATIGVDGKYGRHYSFLKAISVFFAKFIDTDIIATYKIDLDQVFDQEKSKQYTGSYALAKLVNNKLGAFGVDKNGDKVELAMVAGYLINDVDIDKSLYEPDVAKPSEDLTFEQYIFNSQRPQYVSTVAEMLCKHESTEKATMRYHITGGMNGVLTSALKKYKPFTPSFIARAEDQCFMLSIINKSVDDTYLRCYHQDGFFMRHDKGTFLSEDLKIFEVPKKVGDYERVLLFTHYAKDILKCKDVIKAEIQPFTGAFIVDTPYASVMFRALFAAYELSKTSVADAKQFLELMEQKMAEVSANIKCGAYKAAYENELQAWEFYYNNIENCQIDKADLEALKNKILL